MTSLFICQGLRRSVTYAVDCVCEENCRNKAVIIASNVDDVALGNATRAQQSLATCRIILHLFSTKEIQERHNAKPS
jgi:hypothetical protein